MINQSKLVQLIDRHFNLDELEFLGLDLEIDLENIPGKTKREKARQLIAYLHRRHRLEELILACEQLRPNVEWKAVHEEYALNLPAKGYLRKMILVVLPLVIGTVTLLLIISVYFPEECGIPIVEFKISSQLEQEKLVLPNSTYESGTHESLLIHAFINGYDPDDQREYTCDWRYAGDGEVTSKNRCNLVIRTGKDRSRDTVTLLMTKSVCTNMIVETFEIHPLLEMETESK